MLTTYTTDGSQTRFTFNWPYLDRSHIMVTRDTAPALFKFIGDYEVEVKTLFGEPLPQGEKLKIFRVTPDLVSFAEFKDASNLSAQDLNRARLQVLFLIQERSGGIAGSVSQAVQVVVNEIETISGALDSLQYSQGLLQSGLQTIGELGTRMTTAENEGAALRDAITEAVNNFDATTGTLSSRVDAVEVKQSNLTAAVNSSIATLVTATSAQASRVDSLEAKVDAIDTTGDQGGDEEIEALSASLIQSAIASVKNGVAMAKRVETLEVKVGDDLQAIIQTEQQVRAAADAAMAEQITTLQAAIDGDLAQLVEEMSVTADKVTGLSAQWTMKAQVQRADGKPVFAGIGLAATANNDLSRSEIIMQADRLVFVAADNLDAPPKPILSAGLVDGSPTLVVSSNTMGDRTYPGRILVDGSIEGRSIAANTITGDLIKAGAVTTEKLDVNLGVNLLKQSQFTSAFQGWAGGGNIPSNQYVVNGAGTYYQPGGLNYAALHQTDTYALGGSINTYYSLLSSADIPCTAGERYEFSAYIGAHRCENFLQIVFRDVNGAELSGTEATERNNQGPAGGPSFGLYKRLGGFAVAPATAASCYLRVFKGPTKTGGDSWCMFVAPMVAVARPNQTRLSPWGPSGLGTQITPEGISTPSISALSANLGTFVSGNPNGLRTVITGSQTLVYDENNRLRVRMGVW